MTVLDQHVHSNYSDGSDLEEMVSAAARASLDGVGVADHCNITSERIRDDRGYFFHESYRSRRKVLRELNTQYDLTVFDAVEVDYYPHDERRIREFLEEADFDYTIGSVHYVKDRHVANVEFFSQKESEELQRLVDGYVDSVVQLIDSELFDVAAHLDVLERYEPFRNRVTETHYEQVADALEESRTIPEVNVGRALTEYGKTQPKPDFLEYLHQRGVEFTFGTDAHTPQSLIRGVEYFRETLADSKYRFVRVAPEVVNCQPEA